MWPLSTHPPVHPSIHSPIYHSHVSNLGSGQTGLSRRALGMPCLFTLAWLYPCCSLCVQRPCHLPSPGTPLPAMAIASSLLKSLSQSPSLTKRPFLCPQVPFILIPFLKVTVLVRYNSYSTKFTLLKYTIQWYIQSCVAIATIQFQNIFQPAPQRNPVPISSPSPFSPNSSSPCNQESRLYRFAYSVGFV